MRIQDGTLYREGMTATRPIAIRLTHEEIAKLDQLLIEWNELFPRANLERATVLAEGGRQEIKRLENELAGERAKRTGPETGKSRDGPSEAAARHGRRPK